MLFILLSSTFPWLPLLSLTPPLPLPSLLPHSPHSCSYFVVKSNCQIDSTFCLFARFSPTSPAATLLSLSISLYLARSLGCPLSFSPVSHPDLAEPQIIEWFEFLYWICCLTRSSFLVPHSSASPSISHAYISVLCPRGFSYFSLLPFFTAIFACCFFCVDIFFY